MTDEKDDNLKASEEAGVSAFGAGEADTSRKGESGESVNPNYGEPDSNGFVGVDAVYANFANDTDEPLEGDDEDDKKSEPKKAAPAKQTGASVKN